MADAKIGGTWRTIKLPHARVSGNWRPCKQMYAKVGGVWKIVFDITAADPFDGSGSLQGALTPGYVPWEVVSGSWVKSGGSASVSDASNRIAAIDTGTTDVEIEIDRTTLASGGDGVAFWIQDQSNWWGVRAYTEEYFVPFSFTTYFLRSRTDVYSNRTTNTVPGSAIPGNQVPGNQVPGNQVPGNTVPGNCTNSTGCVVGCCAGTAIPPTQVPGNQIPGTYKSCYWTWFNSVNAANTNRFTSTQTTRSCSCSGNLNNNCTTNFSSGGSFCPFTGACSTTNYPAPCTVNNKGTANRVSSCGGACGNCTPLSSFCVPGNGTSTGNTTGPCPSPSTNFLAGGACTCTYTINVTNSVTNNPPTNNTPTNNPPSNNSPRFTNPPSNNTPNNNPPSNNTPNNNPPTNVAPTCSCSGNVINSFSTPTNTDHGSCPGSAFCSNTQPCSSNNTSFTFTQCTNTCGLISPGVYNCSTTTSGANAAYYKRGELVRRSGNSFSVIANQDFGDVGNLYAYTSGNVIGFRQYSQTGRSGTASNIVTYDAGAVEKQTKHGILVTSVPYTQSYKINRFKVNM